MSFVAVRSQVRAAIVAASAADPRIRGLIDYGSASEGRADALSDLDLALFIDDAALPAFSADWKAWAAGFGELLLAYIGGVGHPWVIYEAGPMPLRVDFAFHALSTLDRIYTWPNAPLSVDHMVLYDGTDGLQLSRHVAAIVGQSLAPADPAAAFEQACGDFWYYLIRTHVKLLRGELWAARHDFNFVVTANLLALLRLECGATARWRATNASAGIERVLSPQRLAQLNACIPDATADGLPTALRASATLGADVCAAVAAREAWPWPAVLAERVRGLLTGGPDLAGFKTCEV